MIRFQNATVRFGPTVALRGVTTTLDAGTSVALIGPNGSGKTTLLQVAGGLLSPTSGTVERPDDLTVGYVAQHQHQHRWMPLTVAEVVTMGRYRERGLLRPLTRADRAAVTAALDRLDVGGLARRPFGELSGGQRQRVLMAAALATEGQCILLDEPITGLDLPSQQAILDVVADERDRGRLVVLSTHHLEEARRCDRVLLLATDVVADGPPDQVLTAEALGTVFGARTVAAAGRSGSLVIDDHGHDDD